MSPGTNKSLFVTECYGLALVRLPAQEGRYLEQILIRLGRHGAIGEVRLWGGGRRFAT